MTEQDYKPFDVTEVEQPGEAQRSLACPVDQNSSADELEFADLVETGKAAPVFHREKDFSPQYHLKQEQPHHRAVCILLAQGLTPKEVAEETGFTPAMIAYTKKQEWAQKYIAELQQSQGERSVKAILSGAAAEAASVLCKMSNGDIDVPAPVRLNASKEILNRLFGVAPQHIKHETVNAEDLSSEELRLIAVGKHN